ncbi:germination protein, Ger(X)C family [Schinkia azotoformans MEV2011]|jgi:Ger(x)C family germination protein|uniref:Germination protein, Ger(X)C family n=2 Tax=Schinkia azotoformans TaxID=1454 RepID=A0A072NGA8_SCHAZ|nr:MULTISPECIES: Ger(x)C family spore germination protein [Bacillaceae]KEF36729.1 germination protein, Ger(X)C family [Schinkia azotoformans MEV2011]MEC1698300.1 Ger(x)C family spore germination protein [Schinkia azotoformans]MEC1718599.1 Ger(x)C family spore germination protein [Schinkia azotoformans]MEC1727663.1 Ger(x)C family spore germination protein [Schinkia azotoformans]MEC1743702.1 Ger(x)C family spore germination protein [Schinkia azotoformans]
MKQLIVLLMIAFVLLILTGCWDEHEIGEVNYVTTIGIDYKDEKYIMYVQLLDFSNVAKTEGGKSGQPVPLYIGTGSGRTINDAIFDLYRTSQQTMNWSHIGAIIYSESVLEKGIKKVEESLKKNGEFRYTPWMFGTKESIEKILSSTGFFQLPPLYTILYKPTDTYYQYSYIKPMRLHKFISIYNEPGGTALLPSISINETDWKESVTEPKTKSTLKINGAFPVSEGKYKEWLSYEELTGLRWTQKNIKNTPVDIIEDNKIKGVVRITSPSVKINVVRDGEKFHFNIHVDAKGTLTDLEEHLSSKKIEELVTKQIEAEIRSTYQNGIDKEIDVYSLKNILFHDRVKPQQLKDYTLSANSIKNVTVNFLLENRGLYD